MLRLFFALQPEPEVAARLLETAAPLLTTLGAAPVPVSNLHATLCFVGSVAPERLDDLRAAAAAVRAAPITLDFDTFDFWRQPRVLCACASRESEPARALSFALRAAALRVGLAPDDKPFRAHLTLARKISLTAAQELSWPQKISPGFVVHADRFALMESRRGDEGSIYSVVDEWPLDTKARC